MSKKALLATCAMIATGAAAIADLNRIDVRPSPVPGGLEEFYDTVTGKVFVPRGVSYTEPSPGDTQQRGWMLFMPGPPNQPGTYKYYRDNGEIEADLTKMESLGYNLVRVGISHQVVQGNLPVNTPDVDPETIENMIDFLERAQNHGIYVMLRPTSYIPFNWIGRHNQLLGSYPYGYFPHVFLDPTCTDGGAGDYNTNARYLSEADRLVFLEILEDILSDLKAELQAQDKSQLRNVIFAINNGEVGYNMKCSPLDAGASYRVCDSTTAMCKTYDLTDYDINSPDGRQALIDERLELWARETGDMVRGIYPESPLLFSAAVVAPWEHGYAGPNGALMVNGEKSCPGRMLVLEPHLDYLDPHIYASDGVDYEDYFDSLEWDDLALGTPRMASEFYATRGNFGNDIPSRNRGGQGVPAGNVLLRPSGLGVLHLGATGR